MSWYENKQNGFLKCLLLHGASVNKVLQSSYRDFKPDIFHGTIESCLLQTNYIKCQSNIVYDLGITLQSSKVTTWLYKKQLTCEGVNIYFKFSIFAPDFCIVLNTHLSWYVKGCHSFHQPGDVIIWRYLNIMLYTAITDYSGTCPHLPFKI